MTAENERLKKEVDEREEMGCECPDCYQIREALNSMRMEGPRMTDPTMIIVADLRHWAEEEKHKGHLFAYESLTKAADEIDRLTAENERLKREVDEREKLIIDNEIQKERIERLREVAIEFCDRRDRGEVHSNYTYKRFKEALERGRR